jgi:hypothetical protein
MALNRPGRRHALLRPPLLFRHKRRDPGAKGSQTGDRRLLCAHAHCRFVNSDSCRGASAAALGGLTALRDLEFNTITCDPDATTHQLSDDQLRQLARLRLTSLSLPALRDVSWHHRPCLVSDL